ncbi:hypothetical protein C8F04DRAFT_1397308 [Mycena alexandri]|uniref:Uncharacterized protein n=1 Tax=Mycena alexandri TaxID=1745969 RepID=A0AAD6WXV0_9AGAR|nr:hypothetical protein C8F04DRAFT_1397308 [Mycena alexandri]
MFATLKRMVGGRKAADRRADRRYQQREEYIFHYSPDDGDPSLPWPQYEPEKWPSIYHHKCDIEWCGFANYPSTIVGDHRCGHSECPGNFYVSPEMAATIAVKQEKFRRKKEFQNTLRTVDAAGNAILTGSGRSAMEARRRPRVPSYSSVATAPTFVRFPQQSNGIHQDDTHHHHPSDDTEQQCNTNFKVNSLHPKATSTLRGPPRPHPKWGAVTDPPRAPAPTQRSRQPARAPGPRLASQPAPVRPPPNSNCLRLGSKRPYSMDM